MPSPSDPIITRFAPSPTGHLHIGGARTALFCWAFARRMGGKFLLRIEDTDQARSSEASARGILEDLAWLGIDWDEGPTLEVGGRRIGGDPRGVAPFYQSQRLDRYNAVLEEMLERGQAYADFTTPERMAEMRKAAEAAKETFRFRLPDDEMLPLAEQRARMKDAPSVIRLRAPLEEIRVQDQVLGEVKFAPGEVDDFVLRKADGFPTYHFGVVIDDQQMGVTHVLRGQEHLMNTPRHVALQRVLGYRIPIFAHMPLIFNEGGAKMSKRERDQTAREAVKKAGLTASPTPAIDSATFTGWLGDKKRQLETEQLEALASAMRLTLPEVSVDDFRRAGYLPEVICNFIAVLGWNPGMKNADGTDLERFDMDFLAKNFDLARIGKSNARFDRRKLAAFNQDAIAKMTDEEFAAKWGAWRKDNAPEIDQRVPKERLGYLAAAVRTRSKTFREAVDVASFALLADDAIVYDDAAVKKHLLKGEPNGLSLLADLGAMLKAVQPFEPAPIDAAIGAFGEARGLGMGQVAQPLRVALTGAAVSPPLGVTLAAIGRDSALRRIERCVSAVTA
jgi:glutamyl-tRNA synthetase